MSYNIKEILFLLDQSLKQLENNIDTIVDEYDVIKNEKIQQHSKFADFKQRTLKELKELRMILDNEMSLDIAKNITNPSIAAFYNEKSAPLTILMSESDGL